MGWAKLDDRFHEHRKVRKAWHAYPTAIGLHVLALTYCAGHETDGRIDAEFVQEKLPRAGDRNRALSALVDAGLWAVDGDGWVIHDYLDYHPSRSDMEARRARDAERKSGVRVTDSGRNPRGHIAESNGSPNGIHAESVPPAGAHAPRPVPTRTTTPPQPPVPGGGGEEPAPARRVTHRRRRVPDTTLAVAGLLHAEFCRQAQVNLKPFTTSGDPSEGLRRIIGAVVDFDVTAEQGKRMIAHALTDQFWSGPAQPGNVFGPGVVQRNLAAVTASPDDQAGDDFIRRLNARQSARDPDPPAAA